MSLKEKWKSFINNDSKVYNILIFSFEILISLILGISIYKIAYQYEDFGYISRKYLIIAALSSLIIIAIMAINLIKYKKIIEKLFLTFIIPIGILFIIILPIDWVPDEQSHMFRAYDISLGNLITPFGENNEGTIYVPKTMSDIYDDWADLNYSKIHSYMQKKADYTNLVEVDAITKTYFPINYVSSAITFTICRILNVNILLTCYIARLINFLLFCLAGYVCIKIIPFGKLLLAIYMLIPMIIHQAASLSADVVINAITLLFIAYNLKLLYQKHDLKIWQKLIYYLLAISIGICKYVYFPLVFMSLLLVKNKNISKRNKIELAIVPAVLSISVAAVWFVFSQNYVDLRPIIKKSNVQPMEQLKYIIANPWQYVLAFKKAIEEYGGYYLFTFAGQSLGTLSIKIPEVLSFVVLGALLLLPFFEKNEKALCGWQKWLMVIIAIILFVLILTGLYLTWTPLQAPIITGVQGRYFVPVFILILLACIKKGQNINVKNLEAKYFILFLIINAISLTKIYEHFL